jgi:hypothetical protein
MQSFAHQQYPKIELPKCFGVQAVSVLKGARKVVYVTEGVRKTSRNRCECCLSTELEARVECTSTACQRLILRGGGPESFSQA